MLDPLSRSDAVLTAIETRKSVRGFLDRSVPLPIVSRLLEAASRAPSGSNTQPWRIHVMTGVAKDRLSAAILAERAIQTVEPETPYKYYPDTWPDRYLARRRQVGWALYGLLGIEKGDRVRTRAWHDRNFEFFGAPVGLIFTLDRRLALGALIDVGMFAQNIMTAAQAIGLATCPQAAFAHHNETVNHTLGLADDEMVLFGMALGFEDLNAVQNELVTPRAPVSEFALFHHE